MTGIKGEEVTHTLEYAFVHQLIYPPGELLETDPEMVDIKEPTLELMGTVRYDITYM